MKFSLKTLVAAVALGLGVANLAHAAITPPANPSQTDVFVEVYDPTTKYYWVGDLSATQISSAPTANVSLTGLAGWSTFASDTATSNASNFDFYIVGSNGGTTGTVTEIAGNTPYAVPDLSSVESVIGQNMALNVGAVSNVASNSYSWDSTITSIGDFSLGNGQYSILTAGTGGNFDYVSSAGDNTLTTVTLASGVLTFASVAAVPEPGSYALMVAGLLAVGAIVRRRSRA